MPMADTRRDKVMKQLILLSGSLCDDAMWEPQLATLRQICEPRSISLNGFDNVPAMAHHVLQLATAERFALAGFSLGGFVAIEVMRHAPERVSHLALLSTSAMPDPIENKPMRLQRIAALPTQVAALVDGFADMLAGPESDAAMLAQCRATMQRLGPDNYAIQQRALMDRPDGRSHLGAIACPTLVIAGSEDRAVPVSAGRELASAITSARYVELADAGHMVTLERADTVSSELARLLAR